MTSEIKVDTISENTSANGVTIDGVTLKDGGIAATAPSTFSSTGNTNNFKIISTDDGTSTAPDLQFYKNSSSPAANDFLGRVDFRGNDDAGNEQNFITMFAQATSVANGSETAKFDIQDAQNVSMLELSTTSGSASAVFNEDSADIDFRVESNGNANMLFVDGGNDRVGFGTATPGRDFQFLTTDQTDVSIIAANNQYAQLLFGDPDDDNIGSIGYNNSTNIMEFTTNAAHQWSIDASGNWLPAATDHGIYLGVSSATAANLLNDFEIGHYTAALTTGSGSVTVHSSFNQLRYTKIGKLVHVQGYIETNAESSASGTLRVNLPFAIQSSDNSQRSGRSASALLFTIGSNNANTEKGNWVLTIEGAGTSASIVRNNGTNFADDVGSDVDSSCVFIFNIHYMTD